MHLTRPIIQTHWPLVHSQQGPPAGESMRSEAGGSGRLLSLGTADVLGRSFILCCVGCPVIVGCLAAPLAVGTHPPTHDILKCHQTLPTVPWVRTTAIDPSTYTHIGPCQAV